MSEKMEKPGQAGDSGCVANTFQPMPPDQPNQPEKPKKPKKSKSEVKAGAILAYALILANTIYGLIISPYLVAKLGKADYGVYKTIASFSASLTVLDLGFAGTVMRYTAKYRAEQEKKKLENYLGMSLVQIGIMSLVVVLVSIALLFLLPVVYQKFDASQLKMAQELFIILAFNIILSFFENILFGAINGSGKFIFSNMSKLWMIALRGTLIYLLLPIFKSPLLVVGIETILASAVVIAELLYLNVWLKIRIRLYCWDWVVFKESFGYTILLFLQSIIIQFNGNVDNIIIGAVLIPASVTVYSFALQIFNMYENLSSSFSNLFLPKVTNQIHAGASTAELEDTVIRAGRFQFAVLGAALAGFLVLGREFFSLWLGAGYEDCWYLCLILMIPVTIPLVQNVCLSILRARNLMWFRTMSMAVALIANCILTLGGTIITRNYWMAAAGTAASTIIGSIVMMNLYYHQKLGFRVFRMFFRIFHKIVLCLVLSVAVLFVCDRLIGGSWMMFLVKAAVFGGVYGGSMLLFGLNKQEKSYLFRRGG